MLNKRILNLCREKDTVNVPRAFSSTEIKKSFEGGADIVKVFPAARLGSRYLPDIVTSLGKVPLMVVDGIGTASVGGYFAAGASSAGIASEVFNKQDILSQNEAGIKTSIRAVEEKLGELGRGLQYEYLIGSVPDFVDGTCRVKCGRAGTDM